MPVSSKTRADDAQNDNPLRGAFPHTERPPATSIRAAGDEVIRAGEHTGPAGRPEHGAW
jgi:hypothetical protein